MVTVFTTDAAFLSPLDRFLEGICRRLQLTPTQYELAKSHYEAVGNWLEQEDSILAPYRPVIYPQGSLPMGTTNKPLDKEEYDLDFICELAIPWWKIHPNDLLSKVEFRIRQHQDYASRLKRGKRCLRITYAHNFHLDIVPACSHSALGQGQVRIPDRELEGWRDSNSRKYIDWFSQQAEKVQQEASSRRTDYAEPLPLQESLEDKPVLKCAVQLVKRYRDIAFKNMPDVAPVSIVLSTLCADHYQGQNSVSEAVASILDGMAMSIAQHQGKRLQVWNPANKVSEDLGERWDDAKAYSRFLIWVKAFRKLWQQLTDARGYSEISSLLEALFGEQPTKDVIREDAIQLTQHRTNGQLGVLTGTGMLTSQPNAIRSPKNTFYGR